MNGNGSIQTPARINKPHNHFLETWKSQIQFSIETLQNVLSDIESWEATNKIDQEALTQNLSYMTENGMGELVDELMLTGVH